MLKVRFGSLIGIKTLFSLQEQPVKAPPPPPPPPSVDLPQLPDGVTVPPNLSSEQAAAWVAAYLAEQHNNNNNGEQNGNNNGDGGKIHEGEIDNNNVSPGKCNI